MIIIRKCINPVKDNNSTHLIEGISFQKALQDGKFADIDSETCYQIYQSFLNYHNTYNAVDSVFEMSAPGLLEFTDHQDEYLINWRTRGFKTILDLMMACNLHALIGLNVF